MNENTSCVLPADDVCANCGRTGVEGGATAKLKNCTACLLVKYCGVDCQKAHRKQHKKACKKRSAELKDERLYSQGHKRPEGDVCPICTLLIPIPMDDHSKSNVCCMKRSCHGCILAAGKRGILDCVFCRTRLPDNNAESLAMVQARAEKKDPEAIFFLAGKYFHGTFGLQKDMRKAVELYTEAAELGSLEALHNLGVAYYNGKGVQEDKATGVEFHKKAAMQGFVQSRYNLGYFEELKGNRGRAVKHYLISAKMGYMTAIEAIKNMFLAGVVTKEQYAEALRGYQDAVKETKSYDRDVAVEAGK